jgi:hypothetical protein
VLRARSSINRTRSLGRESRSLRRTRAYLRSTRRSVALQWPTSLSGTATKSFRASVTEADKDLYQELFNSLQEATSNSIASGPYAQWYEIWSAKFGRYGGIQGHRPVDLWSSVVNVESERFGRCPQVYVIASDRGLEIGFSVTIHEDDYYNAAVKQRQRNIVPILNHKLPDPASQLVVDLDTALASDGVWKFGAKTRQLSGPDFGSVAKLIEHLKSPKSSNRGGGSIYRVIEPEQTVSPSFDFNATFFGALDRFTPLMRLLVPTNAENVRLEDQEIVDNVANQIPDGPFD